MDNHFQTNSSGADNAKAGVHQQQDMMSNHRMNQQNQDYMHMAMGYNPNAMDISPNQENNMAYIMPPIPMEQQQPMYGDSMNMYYQQPPYPVYDNHAYGANMQPLMSPPIPVMPQFDQYQPMMMTSQVPNYTQRTAYHGISQGRPGNPNMSPKGGHRKHKSFMCC